MNQSNQPAKTPKRAVVIYCSGYTRFGKECLKRVTRAGDVCGTCEGPIDDPFPLPSQGGQIRDLLSPTPDAEIYEVEQLRHELMSLAADNPELERLLHVSLSLAANSKAKSTRIVYARHWETFEKFRATVGLPQDFPVPPLHIVLFVAYLVDGGNLHRDGAPLKFQYVRQIVAALGRQHTVRNLASPTEDRRVLEQLEGYAKTFGTGTKGKNPLSPKPGDDDSCSSHSTGPGLRPRSSAHDSRYSP